MRAIGIDLGTTNSVISYWDIDESKILISSRGSRLFPSVVSFKKEGPVFVGEIAKNQKTLIPNETIEESKRNIGTGHFYEIYDQQVSPEEVATYILKNLKKEAEDFLNEEVTEAVVTVPAYFSEEQRKMTRQAIIKAGLEPLRILSEPSAAALAYAVSSQLDGNILVYDLGGGTFDVSILTKEGDEYSVKSSQGDMRLGGIDFNNLLFQKIEDILENQEGLIIEDDLLKAQVLEVVEKVKIDLSSLEETVFSLSLGLDNNKVRRIEFPIKRTDFNKMIKPLVEKTLNLIHKALKSANMNVDDINTVILSGGSTRVPLVREMLSSLFKVEFKSKINPDELVALGAGVMVGILTSSLGRQISFNDIIPFSLGVEIEKGQFFPLIKKNSSIPISVQASFKPYLESGDSLVIHILQGDSLKASQNLSLGCFVVDKKEEKLIDISFEVDLDGILSVGVYQKETGLIKKITIEPFLEGSERDFIQGLKNEIEDLWRKVHKDESLISQNKILLEEIRLNLDTSNVKVLKRFQAALQYILHE